jgi:hypothetical protein
MKSIKNEEGINNLKFQWLFFCLQITLRPICTRMHSRMQNKHLLVCLINLQTWMILMQIFFL